MRDKKNDCTRKNEQPRSSSLNMDFHDDNKILIALRDDSYLYAVSSYEYRMEG